MSDEATPLVGDTCPGPRVSRRVSLLMAVIMVVTGLMFLVPMTLMLILEYGPHPHVNATQIA